MRARILASVSLAVAIGLVVTSVAACRPKGGSPGESHDQGGQIGNTPAVTAWYPEAGSNTSNGFTYIRVSFNRAMDWPSVERRFSVAPNVPGVFSHEGRDLLYFPTRPLAPGHYKVTIAKGAKAASGETSDKDYVAEFATNALPSGNDLLAKAVANTRKAKFLTFETIAGLAFAETYRNPGEALDAGTGASGYSGEFAPPNDAHLTEDSEDGPAHEGYRIGDWLYLGNYDRSRDDFVWRKVHRSSVSSNDPDGQFISALLDPLSVTGWPELTKDYPAWIAGTATDADGSGQKYTALRLEEPAPDGLGDTSEEGTYVGRQVVVWLTETPDPTVAKVLIWDIYHRPDDSYHFTYYLFDTTFVPSDRGGVTLPPALQGM